MLGPVVVALALAGCTGNDDPPTQAELDQANVVADAAAGGGVTLAGDDALCVTNELTPATLDTLDATPDTGTGDDPDDVESALDPLVAAELSEAIISCVGQQTIARSSLATLSGSASDASLDCAAEAFNRDLVQALVQQQLEGRSSSGPAVEIEISTVFARCFTVDELLELG